MLYISVQQSISQPLPFTRAIILNNTMGVTGTTWSVAHDIF